MEHVIAYEGLVSVSLGLVQKEYGSLYVPVANRRTGIEGTMQRAPYSFDDFEAFLKHLQESKGKQESFALLRFEERSGTREYSYIGHTSIGEIKWPHAVGTTGTVMSDVGSQGKGHGTEAKLLLQYHAFRILGLRNLCSKVKSWNGRSLGHLLKCGYRIVGQYEKTVFDDGKYVDEVLLQCGRDAWEQVWEVYQQTRTLPTLNDEQRAQIKHITQ